jgi:hypothetical protein
MGKQWKTTGIPWEHNGNRQETIENCDLSKKCWETIGKTVIENQEKWDLTKKNDPVNYCTLTN